ncbi:MAG: preprotein translocase subunit SecG [Chitinophagaceae bacterium]
MIILFLILIILSSVILGMIVLVQNPKGGGLAGSIAGLSNQFMGVKQTTDVLEKGTWVFAAIIGVLCVCSAFFIRGGSVDSGSNPGQKVKDATLPAQSAPAAPVNPVPGNTINLNDTNK